METADLIPTSVVAEMLSADRSTISRMVTRGRLEPALRMAGPRGPMLFHRSDVEALLAEAKA